MSYLVTCTYKAYMPAAIDAFANTYLFVVAVRHGVLFFCGFLSIMALCGVTRYNFCCSFFKLTNTVQFSVFLSSAVICNITMTNVTTWYIKLTKCTVRLSYLNKKYWVANGQFMKDE